MSISTTCIGGLLKIICRWLYQVIIWPHFFLDEASIVDTLWYMNERHK